MRLIDADVFKENLDKEFETATDAHDAVDFALEDTPTIEAEPVKHGKWVVRNDGQSNWAVCSECGLEGNPFWRRCPMCAEKMDGE